MQDFFIGTSGYDHPELKGSFYPPDLKRSEFLEYYSTKFNSLEINSSFYGMPSPQQMESYCIRSHNRIQFSIKTPGTITHQRISLWQNEADEFKKALNVLAEKNVLGAVLVQFPESFIYNNTNRVYLADVVLSRCTKKNAGLPMCC